MAAHQAPLSLGFSRQEYWSGLPLQSEKTRPGADCGSDHELIITKFRLKLKKVWKTTRPFRYDLNQIPYDYTEATLLGGKKKSPQNTCLTTTASGEVAQMLLSATSKRGLGREVQAASSVLRVTTGPECHENNLRELM